MPVLMGGFRTRYDWNGFAVLMTIGALFGMAGWMLLAYDAPGSNAAAAIAFGLGLLIELVAWREVREKRHDRRAGVG